MAVVLRPRTMEQILSRSSHENVVVIVYAETQWRRYPAFCSRGKTYHVEWLQTSDHPAPAQPAAARPSLVTEQSGQQQPAFSRTDCSLTSLLQLPQLLKGWTG